MRQTGAQQRVWFGASLRRTAPRSPSRSPTWPRSRVARRRSTTTRRWCDEALATAAWAPRAFNGVCAQAFEEPSTFAEQTARGELLTLLDACLRACGYCADEAATLSAQMACRQVSDLHSDAFGRSGGVVLRRAFENVDVDDEAIVAAALAARLDAPAARARRRRARRGGGAGGRCAERAPSAPSGANRRHHHRRRRGSRAADWLVALCRKDAATAAVWSTAPAAAARRRPRCSWSKGTTGGGRAAARRRRRPAVVAAALLKRRGCGRGRAAAAGLRSR